MMRRRTLIPIASALVLIGALAFLVKTRYKVWFGDIPEPPYAPLCEPGRILLTFGTDDALSRNVSWQCDSVLRNSYLLLADLSTSDTARIEAQGEVFRSRSGQSAYYVARLRHLRPDNRYAYSVTTNGKSSPWYEFDTHNGHTSDDFSFIYAGDVQDTVGGIIGGKLKRIARTHPEAEFYIFGGDLIERPMDVYFAEAFRDLDSIGQHLPILNVTGNHDYLKNVIRKLEKRFTLVFSYFTDSEVGRNQVYTLRYNNLQLFLLDSNREFFHLAKQRKWLKHQLEQSTAKWKIVVLHHPLHSLKGWGNNLVQRMLFDPLVRKFGVDLVLQGHEHAYARLTNKKEKTETTPVYIVSHLSPKSYRIHLDPTFDKYGLSGQYYQKIRIHADTLTYEAFDANTMRLYDALDIVAEGQERGVTDRGKHIPENLQIPSNLLHGKKKKVAGYADEITKFKKERGL